MLHGNEISNFLLREEDEVQLLLLCLSNRVFTNRQSGFALVTNNDGKLVAVATDSDIRKFLLANGVLPRKVRDVANRSFISVSETTPSKDWPREVAIQMAERGWSTNYPVRYVPVVNSLGKPIGILDTQDFQRELEKFRDQVVVVGLGYVGLTVALALAERSKRVIGVDISEDKIEKLTKGRSPLYETGLDEILINRTGKNLLFATSIPLQRRNSGQSTTYVICLPTPLNENEKKMDLTYINNFISNLIPELNQGDCVVLRSTVPLGTGRQIVKSIEKSRNWKVGSDFYYVGAPERTVEGDALREIRELPQIIGGATPACLDKGVTLFADVCKVTLSVSSIEAAELIKLAGNAFRDYTFAFANALSEFSRNYNIDINEVIEKSNLSYSRSSIPMPSPGVGGPCLTKDPYLLNLDKKDIDIIVSARQYNESVPGQLIRFVSSEITEKKSGLAIGIAFKGVPPTDDLRNSTNLEISTGLGSLFDNFYEWDAVADVSKLKYGMSEEKLLRNPEFDFIGVLNNHSSNPEIVKKILSLTKRCHLTIFDPWRIIDVQEYVISPTVKSIKYLTMSIAKELSLGT